MRITCQFFWPATDPSWIRAAALTTISRLGAFEQRVHHPLDTTFDK
ncbi:hypothetical protein [Allorhodopirellula heiligendammensis]|nr:hypothetical protein [Allorhodopirellula heiligendammensis]